MTSDLAEFRTLLVFIVSDWEGQNPRLQAKASASARQVNFGDGRIPTRRAYDIRDPPASGVDHEVSAASAARRSSDAGTGSGAGNLRAARCIDHEGSRVERSCASADLGAATGDNQPVDAVAERQDRAPSFG